MAFRFWVVCAVLTAGCLSWGQTREVAAPTATSGRQESEQVPPVHAPVPPSQKLNIRKNFPDPTGRNGYEEYILACELYVDSGLRDAHVLLERHSPSTQAEKALALQNFGRVVDLIEQGNRKGARDPRTIMTMETLFPEFTYLKSVVRASSQYAVLKLGQGDGREATRTLEAMLRMSKNLESGILISHLVAVACESICMKTIVDNRVRLSQRDALRLSRVLDELLTGDITLKSCMRSESMFTSQAMEALIPELRKVGSDALKGIVGLSDDAEAPVPSEDEKAEVTRFSKMSPDEREAYAREAIGIYQRHLETLASVLDRPEAEWKTPEMATNNLIAQVMTPVFSQAFASSARSRTLNRITSMALLLEAYRWDHNRYPIKLADAVGTDRLHDPLSNAEFHYASGTDSYDLYSDGGLGTGKIDLSFRRPPSIDSGKSQAEP